MVAFIFRRLLMAIPALWGVYTLVFILLHVLPGDPAAVMLSQTSASQEDLARLRQSLGFDKPLYQQYLNSLGHLLQGDLGRSVTFNRPVTDLIREYFPYTLRLMAAGLGLAVVMGLTLGTIAAMNHNRWLDTVSMVIALAGVSIPTFWLALMAIYLFSLRLGWLPVTEGPGWELTIMPAVSIALYSSAAITRLTRSSLLDVLHQDYILTARAKGLRPSAVTIRHALRNALIPVVTIIGVEVGTLLAGTVVIEVVFGRAGIGELLIHSILDKDFPLTQALILLIAFGYIVANLAVDVAYGFLDPRLRGAGIS